MVKRKTIKKLVRTLIELKMLTMYLTRTQYLKYTKNSHNSTSNKNKQQQKNPQTIQLKLNKGTS